MATWLLVYLHCRVTADPVQQCAIGIVGLDLLAGLHADAALGAGNLVALHAAWRQAHRAGPVAGIAVTAHVRA